MSEPRKTRAIVLHKIKYRETSLIATLFTESSGRLSVMVKGAYNKKSPVKANLFQPLYLMDAELLISPKREIQWITEARLLPDLTDLIFDPGKRCIAFFLSEVLYKTLKDNSEPSLLFDFLWNAMQILDKTRTGTANFHLVFLLQLTRYLGIQPTNDYASGNEWFDITTGHFSNFPAEKNIPPDYAKILSHLLNCPLTKTESIPLNESSRNFILDKILDFYIQHVPGFTEPKSLPVLRKIFSTAS